MVCLYAAALRGNEAKNSFICEIFVTISRAKLPVKTASRGAGWGEKSRIERMVAAVQRLYLFCQHVEWPCANRTGAGEFTTAPNG
jgi:hypothetical protein